MSKNFISTNTGVAMYPHLEKPDSFKGQDKYKIRVALSKTDGATFKAKLSDMIKDEKFDTKKPKLPFVDAEEGEGIIISFASKYKPAVFDSKNKPLPSTIRVGGGSKVRVMGELYNYGEGISLRLKQVQVVSLAEGGSQNSAFDTVDDGFVADVEESSFANEDEVSALDL
jgi:hypothetical protein